MDAKQFAWLYLIENGVAGRHQSYYGRYKLVGSAETLFPYLNYSIPNPDPIKTKYLDDISRYGINWNKTAPPESNYLNEFNGTFADSTIKETLVGSLVLNDGSKQEWCADALEMTNVFSMMAAVSFAEERFAKIFGAVNKG